MKTPTFENDFIIEDDESTFLVTYSDLVTLLLVFFIFLYTMGSSQLERAKMSLKEIQNQADQAGKTAKLQEMADLLHPGKFTIEEITGLKSRDTRLLESVRYMARQTGQQENISSEFKDGKTIINISGQTLFSSGSAAINDNAIWIFDEMAAIFEKYPDYTINIKGHTDDNPISTQMFPSNWELSAIRATNVLRRMVAKGIDPHRLTATGYGQIMPRVPNISDKNRAMNRRVEFVLEKKEHHN